MGQTETEPANEAGGELAGVPAAGGPQATDVTLMVQRPLSHGYQVQLAERTGELAILAPDGRICLDIKVTAEGLKVSLDSASLSVHTAGDLSLACRQLELSADQDIVMRAGGSIVSEAPQQRLSATVGDMTIDANDDVILDGERVRLNSPDATRQPKEPMAKQSPRS